MAGDDKTEKVKRYLAWIAPQEGLESLTGEPRLLEGIDETPWSTAPEVERAAEAVERLDRAEPVTPEQTDALEAIILPKERPVVDVVDGSFAAPAAPFAHLDQPDKRATIEGAIPAIGRIELPDHLSLPYGGTGFVVGENLLMTNRHVAELFALGLGSEELAFRSGQTAAIDFKRERDRSDSLLFRIVRVAMVHPFWDMALVVADGLGTVPPLTLTVAEPGDLAEHEVAVIGYPALDPRNNVELQQRIFGGVFNVKRMAPGRLREIREVQSFGHPVGAVTHDSSTLGGNSGSAVVDIASGAVVALHFAGRYLDANFAVPAHALARDRRVVEAGVWFDAPPPAAGGGVPWDEFWTRADPPPGGGGGETTAPAAAAAAPGPLSWTIPIELTVQLRAGAPGPTSVAGAAATAGIEAFVEPIHDPDLTDRPGYDPEFLGTAVPLPVVRDTATVSQLDDCGHVLRYEHFSIVQHKARRLALFTASNVATDPARREPEPGRDYSREGLGGLREHDLEKWFTDPRVPALHQLPDRFFTNDRKSFDKGHIVRRNDVAWGATYDEVRRANGDTFHVTNCSPQIARFNQSLRGGLWGRLENLILDDAEGEPYCIFAGPVLRDDDRPFEGVDDAGPVQVPIPRTFWKVVVTRAAGGGALQAFAFTLDQDLSAVPFEELVVDAEWRERMIAIPALEAAIGALDFPAEVHAADQFATPAGAELRARTGLEPVPA